MLERRAQVSCGGGGKREWECKRLLNLAVKERAEVSGYEKVCVFYFSMYSSQHGIHVARMSHVISCTAALLQGDLGPGIPDIGSLAHPSITITI